MSQMSKYDPFKSWLAFPKWMNDFDESFSNHRNFSIKETDKNIIVEAVVAGVDPSEVDVDIEDGVVTIKAEKSLEKSSGSASVSSNYKYYYTCALSGGKWDKTEAKVKNGVLILTIPKAQSAKKQKIKVS